MNIDQKQFARPITREDRTQLASLIHFSTYVHRHLDWRTPLNWIDHPPFYALETNHRLISSLACSPDIPEIAWVRVFVCDTSITPEKAWAALWPGVFENLKSQNVKALAAIPIQKWFRELLEHNRFHRLHDIITLAWDSTSAETASTSGEHSVRTMQNKDLEQIQQIDTEAFDPLWQHSPELIELAFSQASHAAVFQREEDILGYQISTPTQYGAHLGRLAVHPKAQRQGVGFALLQNLQRQYFGSSPFRISVNTHNTNQASLALYDKAGFSKTSESYPVYQYKI